VDVQFVMERDDLKPCIKALHGAFIEDHKTALKEAA
jgi:aspartate kinase